MNLKLISPLLGLMLIGCVGSLPQVEVRPAQYQCPTYPTPPAELMVPPASTDYLSPLLNDSNAPNPLSD